MKVRWVVGYVVVGINGVCLHNNLIISDLMKIRKYYATTSTVEK